MKILPNASQMRAIDHCAINHFGIPGVVLMENAGLGTVFKTEEYFGPLAGRSIPIFIGPGNNGGDGLVMARHFLQRQARPLLVFLVDPDRFSGDSATNLAIVRQLDIPGFTCSSAEDFSTMLEFLNSAESTDGFPGLYVDAIFGTGLQRPIEGHFRDVIHFINTRSKTCGIPVVAVDTPSGLNSDDGTVSGICINATMTATYGYAKVGQLTAHAPAHTGALHVLDIGIPEEVTTHVPVSVRAIDASSCSRWTTQLQRSKDDHKGSFGHLLIIGGSPGKTGAPLLAGLGALRSGCGLVSLCCPHMLSPIYESMSLEIMTIPLTSQAHYSSADIAPLLAHAADKNAAVIGPGIGQDPATVDMVIGLYNTLPLPLVVDADALTIIAAHRTRLQAPPAPRILTPHPGEMARLIGTDNSTVQHDRMAAVQHCLSTYEAVAGDLTVILKGAATIVATNKEKAINTSGNPGMAAGGMGDVLSGLAGSLICQGLPPYDASCFSVFLHGHCGDRLHDRLGIGFSASELADELGEARRELLHR